MSTETMRNSTECPFSIRWASFLISILLPYQASVGDDRFGSIVTPILKKHCFDCHTEGHAEGGVELDRYSTLADARRSPKTWLKVWDSIESGSMPPHSEPRVALEDIQRVTDWIQNDLLPTLGDSSLQKSSTVIRRLNRQEYNHTLHDLLDVDGDYSQSFPSDEMSFGYDNIGTALSVSPIHIERYLRAAERVVLDAIAIPDVSHQSPRELIGLSTYPLPEKGTVSFDHHLTAGQYQVDFSLVRVGVAETVPAPTLYVSFGTDSRNVDAVQIQDETVVYRFWLNVFENDKLVTVRLADRQTTPLPTESKKEVTSTTSGDQRYGSNKGLHVDSMVVRGPYTSNTQQRVPVFFQTNVPAIGHEARLAFGRERMTRFIEKAFRHPLTPADTVASLSLYEKAIQRGESCERAIQIATMFVLVSPKFLYHMPYSTSDSASNDEEWRSFVLANRLSYFLWGSLPDDTLWQAAATRTLRSDLTKHVSRMLADPKSKRFVTNFAGQWLQLRKLRDIAPDSDLFPDVDPPLVESMQHETELYVDDIIRNNGSVLGLLDSNYTFVNDRLARYYGIQNDSIDDSRFVRVELPESRGGLMTQASILTLTSNPKRTSPVKRGQWILERLLGTPPPPPPPNVPELDEKKDAADALTLRERFELHRTQPDCAACHRQMDAIGFALENFDAVGIWREKDGQNKVDASGTLSGGRTFSDAKEMRRLLVATESKRFARCLIENLLTYALGRGLEPTDYGTVESIRKELTNHGFSSHTLIQAIVASPHFQSE